MTSTMPRIVLVDLDETVVRAFGELAPAVGATVFHGSIFDVRADAVVSPANSFGFMDGGIDLAYLERFGMSIQDRVQGAIRARDRELLVGEALCVPTLDERHPYLIAAPTMRVPRILPSDSINPYLAMRAVLHCHERATVTGPVGDTPVRDVVRKIAVPGLATGVGCMPPVRSARLTVTAIADHARGLWPDSWMEAVGQERDLRL